MKIIKKVDVKFNLPKGFSSRIARLSDAIELTNINNQYHQKFNGRDGYTVNEIETDMKYPGLNLESDSIVITNSLGKLVAFAFVYALGEIPIAPHVFIRVQFEHLNLGIGSYLHEWGIERAKKVIDKLPEDYRVVARSSIDHRWQTGIDFLEDKGMSIARFFFTMKIEMNKIPSLPTWPEGIKITTYKHPEQAKEVYLAIEDAFKDHYGYVEEEVESAFKRFEHGMFKDEGFEPNLWHIAMDGDKIAGFSICRKMGWESKEEGYVNILGVVPEYRRMGLASSLLLHSFRAYFDRGQKIVTLDVDGDSLTGAVDLYKKVGMHKIRQNNSYEIELRPGKDIRRK